MQEFNYLSYHTEYTCEGSFNVSEISAACFARAFALVTDDSDVKYTIVVYKGLDFLKQKYVSNACLLSKHQLSNHLKILKSIYPLSYKITEGTNNHMPVYNVNLHIKNTPYMFHKYALTWLRYAYEYPYNVFLLDTYRLKKLPNFRFTSIATLFNVVATCFHRHVGENHSIRENCIHYPLTRKELKSRLSEVRLLNDIYKIASNKHNITPLQVNKYSVEDIEYWSEEAFEQKLPYYLKWYNENYKKQR